MNGTGNYLCIDPGLRGLGAALFLDGRLSSATYIKNPVTEGRGYAAHAALAAQTYAKYACNHCLDTLVIEHPRIYGLRGAQNEGETDPNDLLDLAGVGAAVASYFFDNYGVNPMSGQREIEIQTVFPSEWKGTMKKELMTERIREKLVESGEIERVVSPGKTLEHNVLDACGIGLWKLGRLNSKVYPGATR